MSIVKGIQWFFSVSGTTKKLNLGGRKVAWPALGFKLVSVKPSVLLLPEHLNYLGIDEKFGPVALSLKRERLDENSSLLKSGDSEGNQYQYRIIVRTSEVNFSVWNFLFALKSFFLVLMLCWGWGWGWWPLVPYFCSWGHVENLGRESLVMYAPWMLALLNEGDACKKEDKEFLCSQLLGSSLD